VIRVGYCPSCDHEIALGVGDVLPEHSRPTSRPDGSETMERCPGSRSLVPFDLIGTEEDES